MAKNEKGKKVATAPVAGKRDWKKIVANRPKDSAFFLKECAPQLTAKVTAWEVNRKKVTDMANELSKLHIITGTELENIVCELREELTKLVGADVWQKQVGFDPEALKDGLFIVTIDEDKNAPR